MGGIKKQITLGCLLFLIAGAALLAILYTRTLSAAGTASVDLLTTGWDYMPGVSSKPDGLHVSYLGRQIVRQDGTPGMDNPPVNLYGTHLSVTKDFSITANVANLDGSASLQFFSIPPTIMDEFRINPKGITLQLNRFQLSISAWDGSMKQNVYKPRAVYSQSYPLHSQTLHALTLARNGSQMIISADGKQMATLAGDYFVMNNVWFGLTADNPGNHWILGKLQADAQAGGSVTAVNTESVPASSHVTDGLQTLATQKRVGFLVGAAMASAPATSDASYAHLAFDGNFGSMTTENVLKWQFVHPQPDVYDFKEADGLVDQARKNGMIIHGHTLIFGEANPAWVQNLPTATEADKAAVQKVMINHISQVVGHFKGRIASWDVVNEPLAEDVSASGSLRNHIWYQALGENYIATAFRAAHAADPGARLYINDFGLEADGDRWNALFMLVSKLKSEGVPIDGVGFESHVYEQGDEIDPATLTAHIRQLAGIGLVSRVSEMDVYSDNGTDVQAKQYADVFRACLDEPTCVSWTTWGITNHYDYYLSNSDRIQQGQDLLWNQNYSPTPAVGEIRKILTQ